MSDTKTSQATIASDNQVGQDPLRLHNQATAKTEDLWARGAAEGAYRNSQREETAQRRRDEMDADRQWFINARFPLTTPGARTSLADLKKFDDAFLQEQRAKGHPIESLEREIAEWQEQHAVDLAWWAEKEYRQAKEEADRQSVKLTQNNRLAVLFGEQLREVARELVLAGVLNVK